MGSVGDVVEISSDEENVPVATRKLPVDPLEWVAGLFDGDDEEIGEGFDDLEVMSELSAPPVPQKKGKLDGCGGDGEDDDCVVLASDPDKAVTVAEDKGNVGDGSSDELQIVAEKGPVACRDFPHSRHLCSDLPFSTTSHMKHCRMCHCFVCDAPAPCNYWGKGTSIDDHCHATDKETKWKTLREAFKCKSLPASHPEKHQNDVYPTITSPRQQDIQCQVSVPQSHPSFIPNMSHPSVANRSPLLNVVSQNQQRHTSVRVSLNVARTVCAPRVSPATRAGKGTTNAHTPQITHSHARFKRVGSASPGLTTPNANQFGSAVPNNALMHQALPHISQPVQVKPIANAFTGTVQNNAPQRSLSAPIAYQGQPAVPCQVASNGIHGIGPQFSRCTSLTTQRTQFLQEPVMDVCTQSWQDILLSVASDQGVGLHAESVAATVNLMSSNGHDLSNHTTDGNVQADGPMQTTQTLHHLNCQSSLVPNEVHLNSFVSSPADGLLIEAAHQSESSGLDSPDLLFDFELERVMDSYWERVMDSCWGKGYSRRNKTQQGSAAVSGSSSAANDDAESA